MRIYRGESLFENLSVIIRCIMGIRDRYAFMQMTKKNELHVGFVDYSNKSGSMKIYCLSLEHTIRAIS